MSKLNCKWPFSIANYESLPFKWYLDQTLFHGKPGQLRIQGAREVGRGDVGQSPQVVDLRLRGAITKQPQGDATWKPGAWRLEDGGFS